MFETARRMRSSLNRPLCFFQEVLTPVLLPYVYSEFFRIIFKSEIASNPL